jgi:hypothetical protein
MRLVGSAGSKRGFDDLDYAFDEDFHDAAADLVFALR